MPGMPSPAPARPRRRASALVVALVLALLAPVLGAGSALAADPPSVLGIVRADGAPQLTNGTAVAYDVTFSEPVVGVDVGDLVLTSTGTASGTVASITTADSIVFRVAVVAVSGDGTLRLDLRAGGVAAATGGLLVPGYTQGQTYTFDHTPPEPPTATLDPAGDSGDSSTDGVTSVATPTVTGRAEASSSVVLLEGTTVLGSTTADVSGAWVITGTTLADGSHTLTAQARDAAGNVSPRSAGLQVVVDTRAPDRPVITSPASTTSTLPTLTGTAEQDSTVTVTVGGATYVTRATGGAWRVDLATELPASGTLALDLAGGNAVTASARDLAGNVSAPAAQTLVIDTAVPVATSVAVPAAATYAAGSALDFTVTFSGTVVVDTTGGTPYLGLQVGPTPARASYVSGSGSSALLFRAVVAAGWSDADGVALGAAVETGGGALRSTSGSPVPTALAGVASTAGVLVDGVAPDAPTPALAHDTGARPDDGITSDGEVRVGGLEPGATWSRSTDAGRTWTPGSGSAFELAEGAYAAGDVRVRQQDAAGNTGPDGLAGALVVDRTAPADLALSGTRVRETAGARAVVGALGAADAGGTPWFSVAGGADAALFAVEDGRLLLLDPAAAGVGPRTVRVAAEDLAGNVAERAFTVEVVANHAPTVAGVPAAAARVTVGESAALAAPVLADADGDALTVVLTPAGGRLSGLTAGTADGVTAAAAAGVWTLTGPAGGLGAALAGLAFTADAAGPASVTLTVDDGHVAAPVTAVYALLAAPALRITAQPADRLGVVPGGTATFEVQVADRAAVASVAWQVAATAPGPGTAWRAAGDGYALTVTPEAGAWYRAVLVAADGTTTVSGTARLTLWDVATEVGAGHDALAARFPGAADLSTVVPGLRLADLPGTVTLTLPWAWTDSAVTVYAYSSPRYLGTFAVSAGSATLADLALEAGEHYLVVVGVDSREVTVLRYDTAAAAAGGTPVAAVPAAPAAAPGPTTLPVTGAATSALGVAAGLALAAGAALLAATGVLRRALGRRAG